MAHLNPQLTLAGRADVAYRLLLQETCPAWLYPVKHGATTIWERWDGWTEQGGFFNPHMNSFNHYALGSVGEWLFRHVAGIELDAEAPGFQRFVLCPFVGHGLGFARASHCTMHGEIESHWRLEGDRLSWAIRIPANTTACVGVPSDEPDDISLDGTPLTQHPLASPGRRRPDLAHAARRRVHVRLFRAPSRPARRHRHAECIARCLPARERDGRAARFLLF